MMQMDPHTTPRNQMTEEPSRYTDGGNFGGSGIPEVTLGYGPSQPTGRPGLAWLVIVLLALGIVLMHNLPEEKPESSQQPAKDSIEMVIMTFQGKMLVGVSEMGFSDMALRDSAPLNTGPLPQRMRYVVLAGELGGAGEAARHLRALKDLLEQTEAAGEPVELTEENRHVLVVLDVLYDEEADAINVETLDADDRDVLVQELGWFGELALLPPGTDAVQERQALVGSALRVAVASMVIMVLALLAGGVGAIALILLLIFALQRILAGGMGQPGRAHHGIYAETFAVWLVLFFGLQFAAGALAALMPASQMLWPLIGFFASLLALAWPVFRGVSWADVREDTGLTWGRKPAIEPFFGVLGYVMGLPMLLVGVVFTMLLIAMHGLLTESGGPLDPITGPAHPVVDIVAGANWWGIVQIYLLAAVAAPIVEEIMFRGVLYRHQRDSTRHWGIWASVTISATINGFLFAAIHPQGLLAVPVLMSLAYAFTLVREWRGTIVPSIIVHAISNGLVMTLLITMVMVAG